MTSDQFYHSEISFTCTSTHLYQNIKLYYIITYCITLGYLDIPINVIRKLSMNIKDKQINHPDNNLLYYTSDSLWKIWLVESIQLIHNSLWTWHDKCNICCKGLSNCRLLSPLDSVFTWYHESSKPRVCVICRSQRLRQITQTRGFDNSWYHAQPHPIIVYEV